MNALFPPAIRHRTADVQRLLQDRSVSGRNNLSATAVALIVIALPAVAFAQSGSPFDTGNTNLQTLARCVDLADLHQPVCVGVPGESPTPTLTSHLSRFDSLTKRR